MEKSNTLIELEKMVKSIGEEVIKLDRGDGSIDEYFEDSLDVEYVVDSQMRYRGAMIWVCVGGPSIYIDTYRNKVVGNWGFSDHAEYEIGRVDSVDDYWEQIFEIAKECR